MTKKSKLLAATAKLASTAPTNKLRAVALGLMLSGLALALGGCSIESEDLEEQKVKVEEKKTDDSELELTPTGKFIAECNKCVLGDISNLPTLIETYLSTYTSRTDYAENAFTYQYLEPTLAFERCAQKAMQEGDRSAFDSMIIRPARVARISRYFYAQNNPTQGAFWLQRIINTQGEQHGLEVAGRIFIQDQRTIGVGVRLLEQSARLGNRNARQMLLGLMNPGSTYYQEITRNTTSDAIDNTNQDSGSDSDNTGTDANQRAASADIQATHNARSQDINTKMSAQNRAQAQQNIQHLSERSRNYTTSQQSTDTDSDFEDTLSPEESAALGNTPEAAAVSAYTATENELLDASHAEPNSAATGIDQADAEGDMDTPLEAIENTSGEYNVPLEVYSTTGSSTEDRASQAASRLSPRADDTATESSPTGGVQKGFVVPNVQQQNQMQHQARLKAMEAKAEAAANLARERAAAQHARDDDKSKDK